MSSCLKDILQSELSARWKSYMLCSKARCRRWLAMRALGYSVSVLHICGKASCCLNLEPETEMLEFVENEGCGCGSAVALPWLCRGSAVALRISQSQPVQEAVEGFYFRRSNPSVVICKEQGEVTQTEQEAMPRILPSCGETTPRRRCPLQRIISLNVHFKDGTFHFVLTSMIKVNDILMNGSPQMVQTFIP